MTKIIKISRISGISMLTLTFSLNAANPVRHMAQWSKQHPKRVIAMEAGYMGLRILLNRQAKPLPTVTIFGPGKPTVGAPK